MKTTIEWTEWTLNPIRAHVPGARVAGHYCEPVSPACAHCYASRMQPRYGMPRYGEDAPHVDHYLDTDVLVQALRRKKPTRIFWCSMTDLFGEWVLDEWIDRILEVVERTAQHQHIFLTKRAARMRDYMVARYTPGPRRAHTESGIPLSPPWNLTLMVTAEDQPRADERLSMLLETPAVRRGVSIEPMLGPLDLGFMAWVRVPRLVHGDWPFGHTTIAPPGVYRAHRNRHGALAVRATDGNLLGIKPGEFEALPFLDWVIAGGETGPRARPSHPDWFRLLRDQCQAAGVRHFFKGWGEWQEGSKLPGWTGEIVLNDGRHGVTPEALGFRDSQAFEWGQLRPTMMARVGKKAAGCLLDGQEWKQVPEVG